MKVKKLIEILSKANPDAAVVIDYHNPCGGVDVYSYYIDNDDSSRPGDVWLRTEKSAKNTFQKESEWMPLPDN